MDAQSEQGKDNRKAVNYLSYLLRLEHTEPSNWACWRASLEDPHTGARIGFANLEELFAFLMERVEESCRPRG